MPVPANPAAHAAAIAFALAAAITTAHAGPLTPPAGPPAPTNTTLQQIEPRTDIATLPGDADSLHRITQPGSYYLSANISYGVAGHAIIEIAADDVSIDLQGFQLNGQQASTSGIRFVNTPEGATITNGSLRWFAGAAIDGTISRNTTVSKVSVRDSDIAFLFPNGPTNLTDCHAFNCGEQVDFFAAYVVFNGGTLTRCIAEAGPSGGFSLDWVTIRDCLALDNTDQGFTGSRVTATSCAAARNADGFSLTSNSTLESCFAYNNDDDGFIGSSVFRGCVASSNADDGFSLSQGAVVLQCRAWINGGDGFGGSYFTAADCYAEQNSQWGFNSGGLAPLTATNCYALINGAGGFRGGNHDSYTNCHVFNSNNGTRQGFTSGNDSSARDCSVSTTTSGNAFTFGSRATIERCAAAGAAGRGIQAGTHSTITNATISATIGEGIGAGAYSTITSCRVTGAGSNGINGSSHTIIQGCIVNACNGIGIDADANSIVIACISENNTNTGIDIDDNSIARDCVSASNNFNGLTGDQHTTFINCTAVSNTNRGFDVNVASVIRDCTSRSNATANFFIANDCRITGCHSDASDFGIVTNSTDNTIDSNSVIDAVIAGIAASVGGNIITRNTVAGTALPYDIAAGNDLGTVQSSPVGAGAWDNFTY